MAIFTVTIAGPERHDGEEPYDFVVDAANAHQAQAKVEVHFRREQDTNDTVILSVEPGVRRRGYLNDLPTGQ